MFFCFVECWYFVIKKYYIIFRIWHVLLFDHRALSTSSCKNGPLLLTCCCPTFCHLISCHSDRFSLLRKWKNNILKRAKKGTRKHKPNYTHHSPEGKIHALNCYRVLLSILSVVPRQGRRAARKKKKILKTLKLICKHPRFSAWGCASSHSLALPGNIIPPLISFVSASIQTSASAREPIGGGFSPRSAKKNNKKKYKYFID